MMKNFMFKLKMALEVLLSGSTLLIVDVDKETPRQFTYGVDEDMEREVKAMDFI